VLAFLREMDRAGGALFDSDPLTDTAAAQHARQMGYLNLGSGQTSWVTITAKGRAAIAP
jgi:hypothetical protein